MTSPWNGYCRPVRLKSEIQQHSTDDLYPLGKKPREVLSFSLTVPGISHLFAFQTVMPVVPSWFYLPAGQLQQQKPDSWLIPQAPFSTANTHCFSASSRAGKMEK